MRSRVHRFPQDPAAQPYIIITILRGLEIGDGEGRQPDHITSDTITQTASGRSAQRGIQNRGDASALTRLNMTTWRIKEYWEVDSGNLSERKK